MIRARVGAAATVGAALLLAMVNATGASAATAPVSIGSTEIQRSVEPGSVSAYVSSTTNASHLPAGYVPVRRASRSARRPTRRPSSPG